MANEQKAGGFNDPAQAARLRDIVNAMVDSRLVAKLPQVMTGVILDITQLGVAFPNSALTISGVAQDRTIDNPSQGWIATVRVDDKYDGAIIAARIDSNTVPLFRTAAYFDADNPSGSGTMVDKYGRYVTVAITGGVSAIVADTYPSISGGNSSAPQVAPRVIVEGSGGSWRVIELIRGTTPVVANAIPVASCQIFSGTTIPEGWLLCDGSAISAALYPLLASAIGTTYGGTTANPLLPDMRGRVPVMQSGAGNFATLGQKGGEETHALSTAEIASHSHTMNHDHAAVTSGPASWDGSTSNAPTIWTGTTSGSRSVMYAQGSYYAGTLSPANLPHTHSVDVPAYTGSTGSAGSGTAHNNLQPYITLNYIIKAT